MDKIYSYICPYKFSLPSAPKSLNSYCVRNLIFPELSENKIATYMQINAVVV